jgi:hypothetical protein
VEGEFPALVAVRVLLAWTTLGCLWQLAILLLLAWGVYGRGRKRRPQPPAGSLPCISIFKPLPPPGNAGEQQATLDAVSSFCRQIGPEHECLVGIRASEAAAWSGLRTSLQTSFPGVRLRFLVEDSLPAHPNPKVAWLERLSKEAAGAWWLWSDADITAPDGFLEECGHLCALPDLDLATFPYLVSGARRPAGAWDLAFNLSDFMPGVFLLGMGKNVRFALGSGILIRTEAFHARISWRDLGRQLADDHWIGQKLGPGRLGASVLTTTACEESHAGALAHYLRWLKTVRWCQPAGFAAQMAVFPVLGWWLAAIGSGGVAWLGLALWAGWEALALVLACQLCGCRPFARAVPWFPVICLVRPWLRLACWLPWPVAWRGQRWYGPVVKGR